MKKYDIVLVRLDPVEGSEQRGIRPCVVLQSNAVNESRMNTVLVAPLTKVLKQTIFGVILRRDEANKLDIDSRLELSQMRAIDKTRVVKRIGSVGSGYRRGIQEKLILALDLFDEY